MLNNSTLIKAINFAAEKHSGQVRKGIKNIPYINHPIKVAFILSTVGKIEDIDVLSAAILHDVIEDTDATELDLKNLFGEKVAKIVVEVSDDKELPKQERKAKQIENAPNLSYEARLIRIADKISNIQDIASKNAPEWDYDRKYEYYEWAMNVVKSIQGTHEILEEHFYDEHRWGRTNLS